MDQTVERNSIAVPEDDRLRHLDNLSEILDSAFAIPGTRFRIGLDGILGLIPGIGDATGAALSIYLIFEAARLGLPLSTLLRMVGNIAIETVIGAIPIVGDIFDIAWKANMRNMALVRTHSGLAGLKERSPSQILRLLLVPIILAVLALIALPILALWVVFRLIF
jgi:Domain of unknown function (DUF4112)